jgi:hypothetical protein
MSPKFEELNKTTDRTVSSNVFSLKFKVFMLLTRGVLEQRYSQPYLCPKAPAWALSNDSSDDLFDLLLAILSNKYFRFNLTEIK